MEFILTHYINVYFTLSICYIGEIIFFKHVNECNFYYFNFLNYSIETL